MCLVMHLRQVVVFEVFSISDLKPTQKDFKLYGVITYISTYV